LLQKIPLTPPFFRHKILTEKMFCVIFLYNNHMWDNHTSDTCISTRKSHVKLEQQQIQKYKNNEVTNIYYKTTL
jgi:hypothetical protein